MDNFKPPYRHLILTTAMALMAGGALTGCDQPSTTGEGAMVGARVENEAPDGQFIAKAVEGGMLEVELGRLAGQQAISPEVRAFSQQMVTDHEAKNAELLKLAASNNIVIPTTLSPDQMEVVDKLRQKTGTEFDDAYMERMIEAHEDMLELFKDAADDAENPAARTLAERTVPDLQHH